jgi:hypothetical protein
MILRRLASGKGCRSFAHYTQDRSTVYVAIFATLAYGCQVPQLVMQHLFTQYPLLSKLSSICLDACHATLAYCCRILCQRHDYEIFLLTSK